MSPIRPRVSVFGAGSALPKKGNLIQIRHLAELLAEEISKGIYGY